MTQQLTNHTKQGSIRCNTSCRCSENTSLSAVQQVAIVMGQVWVETKSKKKKQTQTCEQMGCKYTQQTSVGLLTLSGILANISLMPAL